MAENGFRAFQRAKLSPLDMQLNTISCILLTKIKLNTAKPVLNGHSKEGRLSLNAGQKYCRMLQRDSYLPHQVVRTYVICVHVGTPLIVWYVTHSN